MNHLNYFWDVSLLSTEKDPWMAILGAPNLVSEVNNSSLEINSNVSTVPKLRASRFSRAEVEMARFARILNFSSNLKFLANRTLIPASKCHYSVCILCANSLLTESSNVLARNHRKCELKFLVVLIAFRLHHSRDGTSIS